MLTDRDFLKANIISFPQVAFSFGHATIEKFMEKINPCRVRKADLIVGIPSYNEADSIRFVVKQVDKGLKKYFPQLKSVIINSDNHSLDGTREVFLKTKTKTPKIYLSTEAGVAGKGNNFLNLFQAATRLKGRVLIMVDGDLKSIIPEWIKKFVFPILDKNYHYVTPLYERSKYDGTITNHICYPLIYGLLGRDIRQPIGGDFACSKEIIRYLLKKRWSRNIRFFGIDIFMTTGAIFGGFKICQVPLGVKIHKASAPKLGPMFSQVTETLFKNLLKNKEKWLNAEKIKKAPIIGRDPSDSPQEISLDYEQLKNIFLYGFKQHQRILQRTLSGGVYKKLFKMQEKKKLNLDENLWSKIVYDMLYAYQRGYNFHSVEAMKPLYFARVASFFKKTLDWDSQETEREITKQAKHFFKTRSYFLRKNL